MINFLRYQYLCAAFSLSAIVLGGALYLGKGLKYDIDFAGGTELHLLFKQSVSIEEVRSTISSVPEWQDTQIQSVGSDNTHYLVYAGPEKEKAQVEDRFSTYVSPLFKDNAPSIEQVSHVGASVGKNIRWNATVSLILCLLVLLGYIALRSAFAFGVGAVVALAHDILAVLIYLSLTGEPFSLPILAALMAVIGYSLNDTIVIFSRIKEDVQKIKNKTAQEIVNISINKTLRRTLLTSFATLLSVLALFFLGGRALHGFSATIIIGIIVGTYSSIYIASPVMLKVCGNKLD